MGCDCERNRTASYGTTDCPDNQHLLRNFANRTHVTCCVENNEKACTWVSDVVTPANCADHEMWRAELWSYINGKLQPVAIFVIAAALVQAITILATCYLMTKHDDNLVHPRSAMSKLPAENGVPGDMPTKSRAVLLIVNTILLLLGAAMVGFSAWLLDFNTDAGDAMSSGGPAVGLAAGAVIIVLSIMGCIGACNWSKSWAKVLLFVYDIALLAIILAEVIGAVLIVITLGNLEGCRDSPFGSSECEDSTNAIREWVNTTRIDCCYPVENRDSKECAWASDVLSDSTCVDFDTFKTALLDYVEERIIPFAILVLLVALMQVRWLYFAVVQLWGLCRPSLPSHSLLASAVLWSQLVTFCSTCCLIKAKGKALVSGNMRRMYKQPSFFYDNGYSQQRTQVSPTAAAGVGGDWATAHDKHGRVYYYNKRTRETRWDPPPQLVV